MFLTNIKPIIDCVLRMQKARLAIGWQAGVVASQPIILLIAHLAISASEKRCGESRLNIKNDRHVG